MELPFFLFLYVIADAVLNHIENGNLLIRWTIQSRNVCMDYLCMSNSNTFGQLHLSLRGVRKIHNYFYFLYLAGAAWNRTIETVKFYLALTRANIPVYLAEAKMLADRLAEEEKIGIVPEGVLPAYCESWFPNEHIIDYMNLPSEDREKFLPFCTWYEEKPAALARREDT